MIREFIPRLYQETILSTCNEKNTLVVLPTGMGKTSIALMLAVQRLKNFPTSKILFLAPTKPLVDQHKETFQKHLNIDESKFAVFTGLVPPEKRALLWLDTQIIFSTPQGLENDIITRRIKLEEVSLAIFDEAHRAVGDYAYNFVAKEYNKRAKYPKILGLTASPGSDLEKITEVCKNLYIEDIEIRTEEDPDVKPYVQEVKMEYVKVELPDDFKAIQKYLKDCFVSKLKEIKKYGYLNSTIINTISKKDILKLQAALHGEITGGNREFNVLKSVSLAAEAMKVQHAIELLETQGIAPLFSYIGKIKEDAGKTKVKAVQNLVKDVNFKSAFILIEKLVEKRIEHPKLSKLKEIMSQEATKDAKIIIFNQYRDTAKMLVDEINAMENVKAKVFVGQAKKSGTGLSQKKQKEMLDEFKAGLFNVLIATSVAEEGLDIPKVDVVLFYEPIPSAIRHIQRKGRTGRLEKGKVIILVTKNTRDEAYQWSAYYKQKSMYRTLNDIKKNIGQALVKNDQSLKKYLAPDLDIKICVDDREKGSGIIKELIDLGINVELSRLNIGDYILSKRCAVEYKTIPDFVDSIIDGRLLVQIKDLKQNYERPFVVIEGVEDIYSQRSIHPNAIRGMLATIMISYGIPVFQTKNFRDTAQLLAIIAKREQDETTKYFSPHGDKKPLSLKEQQEYIVSAFPGIGPALAKPLLEEFGNIKNIVNASIEDLKKVEKIGEKKANEIQRVLTEDYQEGRHC